MHTHVINWQRECLNDANKFVNKLNIFHTFID